LQAAVLLAVISVILHFTIGLYLIDRHTHLLDTLRTPIVVATVVSLVINSLDLKIPEPLMISIKMLGQISIPLMLFTLGIRFAEINFAEWRIGLLGAILCPLSGLLIFFLIYPWFNSLSSLHLGILIVFATLPPAIANYIIAEQFQQEPKKVTSIVLLGNAVSLFSLPVTLTMVLPYFS